MACAWRGVRRFTLSLHAPGGPGHGPQDPLLLPPQPRPRTGHGTFTGRVTPAAPAAAPSHRPRGPAQALLTPLCRPRARFPGRGCSWGSWARPPTEGVERRPARVLRQLPVELGAQRVGGREADHHVAHEVDAEGTGGVGLRGHGPSRSAGRAWRGCGRFCCRLSCGLSLRPGGGLCPAHPVPARSQACERPVLMVWADVRTPLPARHVPGAWGPFLVGWSLPARPRRQVGKVEEG